jgi:hypothetical protein
MRTVGVYHRMTKNLSIRLLVVLTIVFPSAPAFAQDHPSMPAGMTHDQQMAQMKKDAELKQHGHMAMGFDQDKATHHFTLTATGGTIAVTANDASDNATRDQIRAHLEEIAAAFGKGDFEKPMMTHGEMPPGVSEMQRYKADIKYTFEPTEKGALVRIVTANERALEAVHEFLRYQIREHKTGDPVTVKK